MDNQKLLSFFDLFCTSGHVRMSMSANTCHAYVWLLLACPDGLNQNNQNRVLGPRPAAKTELGRGGDPLPGSDSHAHPSTKLLQHMGMYR